MKYPGNPVKYLKCWQGCGKARTLISHSLPVGKYKGMAILENSLEVSSYNSTILHQGLCFHLSWGWMTIQRVELECS